MTFVSYAQNFEDVMLWRALKNVKNGFYIDIGAQDPVIDSVSNGFYQHGWRGVHVEPSRQYARKLRAARPDERVEELLIAETTGSTEFFVFPDTGLSTADESIAHAHTDNGYDVSKSSVPTISLDILLDMYRDRDVHWMKIDVEGLETEVIQSWKASNVRPWILTIESTRPMTQQQSHADWEPLVLEKGYQFAYFDGLNRFYVHAGHAELTSSFDIPPNVFDDVALSGVASNALCSVVLEHVESVKQQVLLEQKQTAREQSIQTRMARELSESRNQMKALADVNENLAQELKWTTERLDSTHLVLHNLITSREWRFSYPLRSLITLISKHWPEQHAARLHPQRIRNSAVRRTKNLAIRGFGLVNRHPKLKTFCRRALKAVGAYDFLQRRYLAYRIRAAQQHAAPMEIAGLGQRASYIYEDLLRLKNKS